MIEYVFTSTNGPFIKSCQELENTIVTLGLEDCKLPILRPITASRFVLSGMSSYEVASILGHTNFITTIKYSHLVNDHVAKKAEPAQNDLSFSRSFRI